MTSLRFTSPCGSLESILEALMRTGEISAHPALAYTFRLVCEEIIVNILRYAYPQKDKAWLAIGVEDRHGEVTLEFRDGGIPFNPLEKSLPDVALPPEQREIGGLGIFLVREMMDEVNYTYRDGENRLTLKKRYPQQEKDETRCQL